MTLSKTEKGYDQIIELEYLDNLILPSNNKTLISILFYFVNHLNKIERYDENYSFEVIKYGLQGYYPVIGVKYLKSHIEYYEVYEKIEEDIIEIFIGFTKDISLKAFIDYVILNEESINKIYKDFI